MLYRLDYDGTGGMVGLLQCGQERSGEHARQSIHPLFRMVVDTATAHRRPLSGEDHGASVSRQNGHRRFRVDELRVDLTSKNRQSTFCYVKAYSDSPGQ